jgi:chromosome segregation ATPase
VDNVQKTTTTTAPRLASSTAIPSFSAAPLVPSMSLSITSATAHSMVQAAKDKWEEMAAELAEINQEAEQTFAALNEMEQEMNSMIQKMQLRESDHQERYAALQQSSAQRQDELLQKIEYITKEYEMFKRDALLTQQASAQQAAAFQLQLQNQISQLQHELQVKVQLLQQESSKAQYYMHSHEQTEQELKKIKQNFEQERLAMNQEQIESTQERIQILRSVNANLRHMSSGSRAIMERMRIKLQCLDGI